MVGLSSQAAVGSTIGSTKTCHNLYGTKLRYSDHTTIVEVDKSLFWLQISVHAFLTNAIEGIYKATARLQKRERGFPRFWSTNKCMCTTIDTGPYFSPNRPGTEASQVTTDKCMYNFRQRCTSFFIHAVPNHVPERGCLVESGYRSSSFSSSCSWRVWSNSPPPPPPY